MKIVTLFKGGYFFVCKLAFLNFALTNSIKKWYNCMVECITHKNI